MLTWCALLGCCVALAGPGAVAEVDGEPISSAALQMELLLNGAIEPVSDEVRQAAVERLVERKLVERFLKTRKTEAEAEQLALAIQTTKGRIPPEKLQAIGDEVISTHLALPLAWRLHAQRVITDEQIRAYYEKHRRELDGTHLRASQIFMRFQNGENASAAPKTVEALAAVRKSIAEGQVNFAGAAKQHSQAPSAAAGGDVGWIGPRGGLPASVTAAAYQLKVGEMSSVVLSPFGAHLVTVVEEEAGELSLEDVRVEVFSNLSRELWDNLVAELRPKAVIRVGGSGTAP